jgi:hypothetical protein
VRAITSKAAATSTRITVRCVIGIDDNNLSLSERALIIAIGVIACIVYLDAGRRDVGTSAFDVTFSPAMPASTQLEMSRRDVPGDSFTVSNAVARASMAVARGRRTALRDLAAVSSAAAIAVFGLCLRAAGLPLFPVALTLLAMMMSQTFWWRGVYWSGDVLRPAIGRTVGLIPEFTALGLCLVAVGAATLMVNRRTRLVTIVTAIVVAALYVAGFSDLPLVLCGWTFIAAAFTWLLAVMPPRSGLALVSVVAVVLIASPALSRMRLAALGRDLDSSLAARSAYELRPGDLPDNAVLIAESRRVDAVARLSNIPIVPQDGAAIDAALREGRVPVALPQAQAHLARIGFLFERAFAGSVSIAIVAGRAACIDLVDGQWRDASTLAASGAFILHGPAYGSAPGGAVVKLAGSQPIRVSTIEPRSVPFEVSADAAETTIRIPRTGREDAVTVTLDAPPASATATADEGTPVTMCPGPLRTPLLLDRRADASAQIHMNELHPFVSGWHPVEADPDFFRWTASENAIVRIPIAPPGPVRLTITATPAAPAAQKPAIAVRVNGCHLDSTPMRQGQGDYEWVTGSECWQPGMNLLTISVTPLISPASLFATHDTRLLGARIGSIRLARMSTGLAF